MLTKKLHLLKGSSCVQSFVIVIGAWTAMCGQHWMKSEERDDDGVKEGNDDGLADKE